MQRAHAILVAFLSQVLWASVFALHLNDNYQSAGESVALAPGDKLYGDQLRSAALAPGERLVRFHRQRQTYAGAKSADDTEYETYDDLHGDKEYVVRHDDYVRIDEWNGRLGNNLHQLFHAISYAESESITRVKIPVEGPVHALFDLPAELEIQPRYLTKAACSFEPNYFYQSCTLGYEKQDYAHALLTYVKPHLKKEVKQACQATYEANQDLVIHLRGGDVAAKAHPQGRMPPCSFYSHLISSYNFTTVKLVVEDGENDLFCRNYILTAFNGSAVQVKETDRSFIADACTLMTSQYVVFGLTSFAEALSMMNDNPKKIFVPALKYVGGGVDTEYGSNDDPAGSLMCDRQFHTCPKGVTEYKLYEIPGMQKVRKGDAKYYYLMKPESGCSLLKSCGYCAS